LNINLTERLVNGNFVSITQSGHGIKQPQTIMLFDPEGEYITETQVITPHIASLSHFNSMIVINPEPDKLNQASITILDGKDLSIKHQITETMSLGYRHVYATQDYIYCFHYDVDVQPRVHAYDWSLVPVTPEDQTPDFYFDLPEEHFPFMICVTDDSFVVQTQKEYEGKVDIVDKKTGNCKAVLDIPTPTSGWMHVTSRNEILMLSGREGKVSVYNCDGECVTVADLGQRVGEIDWRLSIDEQDQIAIFEADVFHFPTAPVQQGGDEGKIKVYLNDA